MAVDESDIKEQNQQEEDPVETLAKWMEELEGAPAQEQIEQWKAIHGDVYCTALSPTEVYLWRAISRVEHLNNQTELAQIRQGAPEAFNGIDLELRLVNMCMLWMSVQAQQTLQKKAGTISTLSDQIMTESNFVNSQFAGAMILKL